MSNKLEPPLSSIQGYFMDAWDRALTEEGQVYYLNHNHLLSQWDHPEYIKMMNELGDYNSVRYAAYRTALKLRHLQKQMRSQEIYLSCVKSAFDNAVLRSHDNCKKISIKEIENIVLSIYKNSFKENSGDAPLCAELLVNMISNSFDEIRTGFIETLKCKILLIVMCEGRLQEKFRFLFHQISDNDNFVSRQKLAKLLYSLACITELLSEQLSFGIKLVPAAVESCFKDIPDDIGITEDIFLDWLLQEPQTLVWWSTLVRLSASEHVHHDIKCSSCKSKPMVGLRYQCLKCLGYNLCQNCFLHERSSKSHKVSHPIQEYCHESTGKEWRKSFLKIVNFKLRKTNLEVKPRYLTISPCSSGQTLKSLLRSNSEEGENSEALSLVKPLDFEEEHDSLSLDDKSLSTHTGKSLKTVDQVDSAFKDTGTSAADSCYGSSTSQEIHSVIKNLEEGQRKLNEIDSGANFEVKKCKEELQAQIIKLKTIFRPPPPPMSFPAFSPNRNMNSTFKNALAVEDSIPVNRMLHLSLSTIRDMSVGSPMEVLDNKENHCNETSLNSFLSSTSFGSFDTTCYEQSFSDLSNVSQVRSKEADYPDVCVFSEHYLKHPCFTELLIHDLSLENAETPIHFSFEFRTLRDSEVEFDESKNEVDDDEEEEEEINAEDDELMSRYFFYQDKEIPIDPSEMIVIPHKFQSSKGEVIDSLVNLNARLRTPYA